MSGKVVSIGKDDAFVDFGGKSQGIVSLIQFLDTEPPKVGDEFDFHVERYDDRVQLFATRLAEGRHQVSYIVRATTAGTFRTAPARAEEMYSPEVFGRTATTVIEIRK